MEMSTMSEENAESQTPATRGSEGGEVIDTNHGRRERGSSETSGIDGAIHFGVSRALGTGENFDFLSALTGGILTQLIQQTEYQLGNAEACIEWYQRERLKFEQQLASLKHLYELGRAAVKEELKDNETDSI